ncbi:hypothetical protein TWF730_005544 [Orbilia blumenaviensis]|uniref:Uncharacterized protein n=1 Tax=Orbilia blumenaviensis TaxID=1796055 RepID=A0AAV9VIP6_9PEZI
MSYAYALRSLSVGARHVSLCARSTTTTATRTIIFHRLPFTSSSSSYTTLSSTTLRGRLQPLQCRRNFWSKLFGRKKKKPEEAVNPEDAKFIYPSSLCLYTPGRRTVWIGCMKLASCYPFLLTVFYLGPNLQLNWPALYTYPFAQSHPNLTAAILLTLTALPMGMFYLAAPYVTHIFIKIPPYARVSQSAVMNWARTGLGEDTRLRIFTMRFLGRPKLVEVPLGELRFCRKRVGCVNLEWVGGGAAHGGKVREKPRVTDFYIERKIGSGKGGHEAFFEVVKWLEENTARIARRQGITPTTFGVIDNSAVGSGGSREAMFGNTTTSSVTSTTGSASVKPSVLKEVKKKGGFKKISR